MSKSNGNLTTILGRRIDFSNQKNQGVDKPNVRN